jgi:midasin
MSRESQDADGFTDYLNKLIPLLDDFIRSSPLGQYHTRMELLGSFADYASRLALSKSSHLWGLKRVGRILQATVQYYSLFSAPISRYFSEQQAAIEREIQTFVKLASWKDINVYVLKQSAQKTHRQLYKSVRKFRDVMRQPITQWLQPELAGSAESKPLADHPAITRRLVCPSFPDGPFTGSLPGHLVDLNRTFQKFDTLVNNQIRTYITSGIAHDVDNLAIDIISTAKTLGTASVSNGTSAEKREKQQKALLVRKRKAWSDLLKELKRGGLTVNVKPDILSRQRDVRWIRELPLMPKLSAVFISVERTETYFSRLQGSLPELRALLSNHHPDISTRELQRGVTLLESGFSIALDARSWYEFVFSGQPSIY